MLHIRSRRVAIFAALLTMGLAGVASASTPPATGLGQAWPNAPDVSVSPNYHAYVFMLGGIQYIQINDLGGNVLGSVGTAAGQFITLPIGRFAQLVSTPQQSAAITTTATPIAAPTTVYNDGTTAITATPMSDGTTQLNVAAICSDPASCGSKG